MNRKQSSQRMTSLAAKVLKNDSSSAIQQKLAGSVLSQANASHQTGSVMEDLASKALSGPRYSETTKVLAGSVLSQANKKR